MSFFKNIKRITALNIWLLAAAYGGRGFAQSAGTNYTRVRMPQIPVTDAAKLDTIPAQRQAVSVAYSDGLGRPLQSIQVKGSANLHDIITPYVYDNMGRPYRSYLPYAYQGNNAGNFRSGAVTEAVGFYNPASPGAPIIPTDTAPYAQTVYEASPLGRVNEQGETGSVFQPGTGHTVRASYQVNSSSDGIVYYNVDPDTYSASTSPYTDGVLTKTVVTDENGHQQAVWKDLQGRTVTQSKLDAAPDFTTDYIYNDLDQLSYILTAPGRQSLDFLASAYIFKYDSVGRVVAESVPDKGWMHLVYNHRDEPVLSQDSNLRARNQWVYMKYDAEGRIVQTGIYTNNSVTSPQAMQQLCDSTATLWETWQPGTGYTDNAFPQANTNLYTTYYYDDYSFPEAAGKPFRSNTYGTTPTGRTMGMLTGTSVYVLGSSGQYLITVNYYDRENRLIQQIGDNHLGYVDVVSNQYNFAGEQTGSQRVTTPLAGTPVTVQDRYVNDHLGRLLDTWESFQGGDEVDISHNTYNEVDQKVTESLHTRSGEGFGPAVAVITRTAALSAGTSDVARDSILLKPDFSFTASDTASYSATIGTGSAQTEEFRYNIRGWLTNINNGTLNNNGITQTDPHALFGESITYWEPSPLSGATPQYNGNISGFTWRNKTESLPGRTNGGQGYSFVYDNVNRFISNSYYTQGTGDSFDKNTNDAYTEILSGYDYMGNITSMERKDKDGNDLNNLLYYYDTPSSNVLTRISDNGSEAISGTFSYDGNGNMTADTRKGLAIHYNYLNLPDTVSKSAINSKLIITYDAAGNKLAEQLDSAGTIIRQRHYVEDVELTATTTLADAVIESVAMDEGRIVNTASGFKYEYNLQDHLYSNRVSFRPATDSTLTVSMVQNYYPFGRDMGDTTMNYAIAPNNRYQYESKEWNDNLGMDMYDFGARYYDPTLATWHSIDPLAEQSAEWSGYNYVEDNPINVMDPDGMQPGGGFGGSQPLINDTGIFLPWNNSSAASTVVGAAKGGGTNFPGILGNSVTAVNGVMSIINAVNASTPGFRSLQDFSKSGLAQGNGMRTQGPGMNFSKEVNNEAESTGNIDQDLADELDKLYPNKQGKTELHHIKPKYLGGDKKGPLVRIPSGYHQGITNEFRKEWGYGQGKPTDEEYDEIQKRVYGKFPIPSNNSNALLRKIQSVTGLTGLSLGVYLIISEGSPHFPA